MWTKLDISNVIFVTEWKNKDDGLLHCIPIFFFLSIWQMQNIWSIADLLCRNPHWWSPIISCAYGVNLDMRMLHKILYILDTSDKPLITRICFTTLLTNRYGDRLLPLLRQFLLISNRINKLKGSHSKLFYLLLSIHGDLWLFNFQ